MPIYIYGLFCPLTDDLRYIGKSVDPEGRLRRHLDAARKPKNYNQRWIASLIRQGLKPVMSVLLEIEEGEDWAEVERAMIAEAKARGLRLTNTAIGGEGILIDDPALERRRKQAIRQTWEDPELRQRQAERIRAHRATAEARSSASARAKQLWADPTYAAKVAVTVKAAYSSPAARKAQSERSRAAHQNPEVERRRSASISAAWDRDNRRERHSAAIRAAWERRRAAAKEN